MDRNYRTFINAICFQKKFHPRENVRSYRQMRMGILDSNTMLPAKIFDDCLRIGGQIPFICGFECINSGEKKTPYCSQDVGTQGSNNVCNFAHFWQANEFRITAVNEGSPRVALLQLMCRCKC